MTLAEKLTSYANLKATVVPSLEAERDRLKAVNAELLAALAFYADPPYGQDERPKTNIPDFYDEMDFGEVARAAIAKAAA